MFLTYCDFGLLGFWCLTSLFRVNTTIDSSSIMISFVDNYYRSDDNTRQQHRVFHHYLQVVQTIRRGYIFVMAAKTSSNISRFSTIIVFTSQILLITVEAHLMFIDDTELSQK